MKFNTPFCKHKWEMLSDEIHSSKLELVADTLKSFQTDPESVERMAGRKVVQIASCKTCGKIKRWVTTI